MNSQFNSSSPFLWLQVSRQANICSLWVSILFKVNKGSCVVEELGSVVILHFQNVHWTLLWPARHMQLQCHVVTGLRKVTGALYPHILRISPLSARRGSVSCGGLSVLWLTVPKDSCLRSHSNVMKFNSLGINHPLCPYVNHVTRLYIIHFLCKVLYLLCVSTHISNIFSIELLSLPFCMKSVQQWVKYSKIYDNGLLLAGPTEHLPVNSFSENVACVVFVTLVALNQLICVTKCFWICVYKHFKVSKSFETFSMTYSVFTVLLVTTIFLCVS